MIPRPRRSGAVSPRAAMHRMLPVCLLFTLFVGAHAGGHLVIIGGGNRPAEVMERMVALAGGRGASIVVIPTASEEPEEVGRSQAHEFRQLGAHDVCYILPTSRTANDDSLVLRVRRATGVFLSGGDQRRLADTLRGTRLLDEVHELFSRGGTIGGTSAGAAAMSRLMITGDQRREGDSDDAFTTIEAGNVIVAEGFGLLPDAIIDQHFVARSRHNRLISLVLEHSDLVGIGIDEGTAMVVDSAGIAEIMGESCAVVYDASTASRIIVTPQGRLEVVGLVAHVLVAGSKYDLTTRTVLP